VYEICGASIVHRIHAILMARYTFCFSFDKVSLHATKAKIVSSVVLSGNISKGGYLPCHVDNSLLDSFIVAPSYRSYKDIISVF